MTEQLLTARVVAQQLGLTTETVLAWVRDGKLPAFRLPGGAIRFRPDDLEAWLEQRATSRQGASTAMPDAAQTGQAIVGLVNRHRRGAIAMARQTRGTTYPVKGGVGILWQHDGTRGRNPGPFRTKTEARTWFEQHVAPRLRHGGPSAEITFDVFCSDYLDRWGADVAPRTKATVETWLAPARHKFGRWTLSELEGAADDLDRWRSKIATDDQRHKQTRAVRQVLAAAKRWQYIAVNPAKQIGPNSAPSKPEIEPFTPDEVDAIVAELADSPRDAGIVTFAAETGLRTSEWPALERRDLDQRNPAVTVQRRYVRGVLTPYPKTERSRRRVPLTPAAVDALGPPRIDTPYLFVNRYGERLNYDNWRGRIWTPALEAAGVQQRGPYHLRHTFATEALATGMSTWQLSRVMGASAATIDSVYGHLAHDSDQIVREMLTNRRSHHEVTTAESEETP